MSRPVCEARFAGWARGRAHPPVILRHLGGIPEYELRQPLDVAGDSGVGVAGAVAADDDGLGHNEIDERRDRIAQASLRVSRRSPPPPVTMRAGPPDATRPSWR